MMAFGSRMGSSLVSIKMAPIVAVRNDRRCEGLQSLPRDVVHHHVAVVSRCANRRIGHLLLCLMACILAAVACLFGSLARLALSSLTSPASPAPMSRVFEVKKATSLGS